MDPIYPWCWLQPSSARLTNCGFSSLMNWRMVALPFAYIWDNWNVINGLKNNSENLCQETPVVKVRAEGECRVQGTHHHLESSPEFKDYSQINLEIPPSQMRSSTCWLGWMAAGPRWWWPWWKSQQCTCGTRRQPGLLQELGRPTCATARDHSWNGA